MIGGQSPTCLSWYYFQKVFAIRSLQSLFLTWRPVNYLGSVVAGFPFLCIWIYLPKRSLTRFCLFFTAKRKFSSLYTIHMDFFRNSDYTIHVKQQTLHHCFIIHFFKCSMFTTKSSFHTVFLFWVAQAVGIYYSMTLCSVYNLKTSFQSKLKFTMNLNSFYNSGLAAHFLFTLSNCHIHILQKLKQVSRQVIL